MAFPSDVTMLCANSNAANSANTASINPGAGKRAYITGALFVAGGATAGADLDCTFNNCDFGVQHFKMHAPTGVDSQPHTILFTFNPPLRANAVAGQPSGSMPAIGAGNVTASVMVWGFAVPEG